MNPSNPMQPRGSFGKPAELVKNIEKHEATRQPINTPDASKESQSNESAASSQAEKPVEKNPEAEIANTIKKYIDDISKELNIKMSEDDLRNYILKGKLTKEVTIIPGLIMGTFQTLRISDLQDIDKRMAQVRDASDLTSKGIENEEALIALSFAWTHADGKALGASPEDREKKIRQMGALFIEKASTARINYDTLVRLSMQERGLVKK